jgi:hypothetical protein
LRMSLGSVQSKQKLLLQMSRTDPLIISAL